jgi:hypothetical protein
MPTSCGSRPVVGLPPAGQHRHGRVLEHRVDPRIGALAVEHQSVHATAQVGVVVGQAEHRGVLPPPATQCLVPVDDGGPAGEPRGRPALGRGDDGGHAEGGEGVDELVGDLDAAEDPGSGQEVDDHRRVPPAAHRATAAKVRP